MIIQCDFDGTVTLNNMSVELRDRFASRGWQEVEAEYLQGGLTVEQSNRQQYVLLRESREVLQRFARQKAIVRPGFLSFVNRCLTAGIRFVIVSSGLDFYIKAVLGNIGAPELEVYCAQTSFTGDGIVVTYLDPEGKTVERGFKEGYLAWLRKQDNPLIYIGDSLSDFDAALAADYVFAVNCGRLHRLLSVNSVSHYTFTDFNDIWPQVRQIGELP